MKKIFIFLTSLVAVFTVLIAKGISADASISNEMFPVIIGGGGGGSASIENYQITTTTSQSYYNGINISNLKDVRSDSWRVGFIGHWYQFTVKSFKKVEGVYSFLTPINKSMLESGDASFVYEQKDTTKSYVSETIAFSEKIEQKVETKFYASIAASYGDNHAGASLEVEESHTVNYSYDYKVSRESMQVIEKTSTFSLSQNSVKYCPSGYNIAVGQVGTYYVGTIEYAEYKNWWGTDYICSDVKTIEFSIANPSKMAYNYIIYKGANSEGPYYYYVG